MLLLRPRAPCRWNEDLRARRRRRPHFLNGDQLWTGTSYFDGERATPGAPGSVVFQIFTDTVEPQVVTLGFASLPDDDRLREIRAALTSLLASV